MQDQKPARASEESDFSLQVDPAPATPLSEAEALRKLEAHPFTGSRDLSIEASLDGTRGPWSGKKTNSKHKRKP